MSPNLLWDLKEDIYENTKDEKQKRDLIISKIGKRLATLPNSPLYREVSLPSRPEFADVPITLNTICATIKSSGILGNDYYQVKDLSVDDAVDIVSNGLLEHLNFFSIQLKFDWDLGKQGFTKSANGISALIWLFRQSLHYMNNIGSSNFYRSKSKRKDLADLLNNLYQPIVEQFKAYKDLANRLRMKRGASGQKESANDLCVYIKSATPEFRTLLKVPDITADTDLRDDNDFDLAIKNTELKIRAFAKRQLMKHFGLVWYKQSLPGDVKQSIEKFVESDIRKYPYKEINTPEKKFDYIELNDLKKTVLSSWLAFETIFLTKERFGVHMDEFIYLRNAFRGHPREIDNAQRNSGRGALIWLNECIKKEGDVVEDEGDLTESDEEMSDDSAVE